MSQYNEYKVIIKIPDAGREIPFSIKLTPVDEQYPKDFFRRENINEKLRETIQSQAHRKISPDQLKYIIDQWIDKIKNNRRFADVTINLDIISPRISVDEIPNLTSQQEITQGQSKVKPARFNRSQNNNNLNSTGKANNENDIISETQTETETERKNKSKQEKNISIESFTNEPDF